MNETPPTFGEHEFRKATASAPDRECVRVARRDGWVEIRDDKTTFGAPDDHRLRFTEEQFDTLLTSIRSGHTNDPCLQITRRADGTHILRGATPHTAELEFTEAEVAAFLNGITTHEFDHLGPRR